MPSPVISITCVTLTFHESMQNNFGYNISWVKSPQIYVLGKNWYILWFFYYSLCWRCSIVTSQILAELPIWDTVRCLHKDFGGYEPKLWKIITLEWNVGFCSFFFSSFLNFSALNEIPEIFEKTSPLNVCFLYKYVTFFSECWCNR